MAWEKFTETGKGYSPSASIWKGGQIGFSQGTVKRFNLERFEYAVLYYNQDDQKIGIALTNDEGEPGATKLLMRGTGAFISAKAFLDYYAIEYPQKRKLDVGIDQEAGFLVVYL